MGIVNVKGTDIYYQHVPEDVEQGSLLYIHGSGGSHEVWHRQMKLGLNSFALDLPGHGGSGGVAATSIDQSAASVIDFISVGQLPRPLYLVGHSMGAAIALTCALNYPQLLDGLILIGAGQRMKVLPSLLDDLSQGKSNPDFIRLAFSPQTPESMVAARVKIFGEASPAVLYADFSACNNFDISENLGEIALPSLVIVGVDDRLTPLKLSQYLASHIGNSRLEAIDGAGHYVMIEKPAEVNRLILDFCL